MPPKDYLRARQDAQSSKDDEAFCAMIDGAPYFPNLVVDQQSSVEERDEWIKKVVELLIVKIAKGGETADALASLNSSSWKVTPVTGGNTNFLFCVSGVRSDSSKSSCLEFEFPNDSLLVRLFGADGMIDRDEETSTYASLAKQELALKYYGRFGNGRIEEMLVGWTTLTEDDLMGKPSKEGLLIPANLNETIARELARLHATFELPSHLLVEGEGGEEQGLSLPEPTLWTQLYPWLERSLKAKFLTDRDIHIAHHELDPPLSSLKDELDWLKFKVIGGGGQDSESSSAGIGFCHNDLLASNLMMLTTTATDKKTLVLEGLRFIDFEYGGINYFAYDIANHFNEFAGGTAEVDNATPDYDRCPNEQEKRAFLEAYAEEYNKSKQSSGSGETITADELSAKVDGFSLANHLVWGLWGVLQAATEGCEEGLDYLHYAKCRFDRYRHDKRENFGTMS